MACKSTYDGLLNSLSVKQLSDSFCRLVPIHEGHIAVHKDQCKFTYLSLILIQVLFHVPLYQTDGFLAASGMLTDILNIDIYSVLKNSLKSVYVENLVINNQDLLLILGQLN
jgi:hypothetical protein